VIVSGTSSVHAAAAIEALEWWEDLIVLRNGSRLLLVPAPAGWGRTWLLRGLGDAVRAWPQPARVVEITGGDATGRDAGEQVEWLSRVAAEAEALDGPGRPLLGVDRPAGVAGLGLNVFGLFVAGFAA
jgi:hypothetical protein